MKHAMRVALTPAVTMFDLADLLGGAFIVETAFKLPGIGRLVVHGVFGNNFPS